jgi:hypothetical protein
MKGNEIVMTAAALALLAAVDARAQAQMPRFVPDVVLQFNALSKRPDPMGFEIGDGPDPSMCRHHQALLRTEAADGTPYFLVTRSGPPRDSCPEEDSGLGGGDPIANLYIVRMGSRPTHGERLRSNRLQRDTRTARTPPDARDRVIRSIPYNGTSDGTSFWPPYDHPGGMQQVGSIAAIGVEFPPLIPPYEGAPLHEWIPDPSMDPVFVQFVNVSDPEHPAIRSTFAPPEADAKAGVVALTPCSANRVGVPCETGHYLLAISGGSDNGRVHFYESTSSDLADPLLWWRHLYTWRKEELVPSEVCTPRPFDPGPPAVAAVNCWHAHQTLQFLREDDLGGALYLAGARGGRFDPDFIDLYRVELEGAVFRITQVATKHLVSHPAWEGELAGPAIADLNAASTFHITPSGELLFYASEHDNDGPEGSNERGSVKMGEWRHFELARPESPTRWPFVQPGGPYAVSEGSSVALTATAQPPITKAWIQLFEHSDYDGRSVIFEFDDRDKDDFDDFRRLDPNYYPPFGFAPDFDGASDEASAWRWFAPVGCTVRANYDQIDNPEVEPTIHRRATLTGEARTLGHHNLAEVANDGNSGFVGDEFTSVQFLADCATHYGAAIGVWWDLNLDGTAETPGPQASFLAREGPAVLHVPVSAVQNGSAGSAHAAVTILNVAPAIGSFVLVGPGGSVVGTDVPFALVDVPYTAQATFTDAGTLDHQTATLAWGDGVSEPSSQFVSFHDAFGGVTGSVAHLHTYANDAEFTLALTVTDDDAGASNRSIVVRVLRPEQALQEIVDALDALIAVSRGAQRGRLQEARDKLDSNQLGDSANGALDLLAKGNTQAAIEKIAQAIEPLRKAETADPTIGILITLLEQIVISLGAI